VVEHVEVVEAVGRHKGEQELVDKKVAVDQMVAVGQKVAVGAVVVGVGHILHIAEDQQGDKGHSHRGAGEEGLPVHQ